MVRIRLPPAESLSLGRIHFRRSRTPAFRAGVRGWRSNSQPGSCYGPAGQNLGDWTAGCLAAKRVLAPSDIPRKAEPEYRAGWRATTADLGSGPRTRRSAPDA